MGGLWSPVAGQIVNGKSAYKSQTSEIYMMFNDCEEMMIADKITGKCDAGFAKRPKKQSWIIDGKADSAVLTKLVTGPAAPAAPAKPAVAPAADVGNNLPKIEAGRPVGKLSIQLEEEAGANTDASSSRLLSKLGIPAKALNSL